MVGTAQDEQRQLDQQIVDLVEGSWKEENRPLLLSQLGNHENGRIGRYVKEQESSLRAYLRSQLSERVRVIQHSIVSSVVGVVPVDADISEDRIDEILDLTRTKPGRSTWQYHAALWTAFRIPLDSSKRRYISIHPPIHFDDTSSEEQSPDYIEIKQEDIVGPDAEGATVNQKIGDWLAEHGLDPTPFYRENRARSERLPSDDLLGRLLFALEPEDLERISIPLDIIKKLRSKSL